MKNEIFTSQHFKDKTLENKLSCQQSYDLLLKIQNINNKRKNIFTKNDKATVFPVSVWSVVAEVQKKNIYIYIKLQKMKKQA